MFNMGIKAVYRGNILPKVAEVGSFQSPGKASSESKDRFRMSEKQTWFPVFQPLGAIRM